MTLFKKTFGAVALCGAVSVAALGGVFGIASHSFALRDVIMTANLSDIKDDSARYGKYSVENFIDIIKGVFDGTREEVTGNTYGPSPLTEEELRAIELQERQDLENLLRDAWEILTEPPAAPSPDIGIPLPPSVM